MEERRRRATIETEAVVLTVSPEPALAPSTWAGRASADEILLAAPADTLLDLALTLAACRIKWATYACSW
jgi:hypothetical protein